MTQTTYRDALLQALLDAMDADETVILMGEEVGLYGGAYGVTKGMLDRFGANRVIDTPISEPAIVGAAIGAAMTGLRPVAEIMYVDFAGMVMDQLANQAAKSRYMFGGQIGVPMVLRTQGGPGDGAQRLHRPVGGGPALPVAGGLDDAHPRIAPVHARHGVGCLSPFARRHATAGPGGLHRAQGAVYDEGRDRGCA